MAQDVALAEYSQQSAETPVQAKRRSAASTEHSQQSLLLQSIERSANIVLVNINCKKCRHYRTLNANMKVLGTTITNIVQNMKPTVICMCEVGETSNPSSNEQIQEVADKA